MKVLVGVLVAVVAIIYGIDYITQPVFPAYESGIILVTGASSGIGRDAALHMAGHGFHVLAGVRKEKDAESLRIADGGLGKVHPIILDVVKEEHHTAALEKVIAMREDLGLPFVGLVNNAGISAYWPAEYEAMENYRSVMEVNYFGLVGLTKRFLGVLREDQGRVVSVTSVAGRFAGPLASAYAASKYAVEAFSDSLRRELRPHGVAVSLIEPGFVATEIFGKASGAVDSRVGALAQEEKDRYSIDFSLKSFELGMSMADTTEVTNVVIHHSLTHPAPYARYPCANVNGLPASLFLRVMEFLPAYTVDAILVAAAR
eukprot:CAMPEP_0119122858 /NCGR_PEP_ID=MMETSP1310-20130426/2989_1 /TAXON_ID=464262 /ORGANISM="Genus nov. species nov., Strain RCC2339" /LENGTH=315 /DNA_ID=CAMNT_0007112581 /DNA_START=207 /DNA_END=1154 /DNA_ORIENTATION=+